ncbi:MAG: patatin-like phospholipase family protein [Anaerolineae bacterium]
MLETLKSIPLFNNLNAEELQLVASQLQYVSYPKGEVIFRQGEIGDTMYLVEKGRVVVWDEEADEALAYLGPGSFVGEIALLLAEPRSASLRVVIDADLYALRKDDFDELLKTNPAIAIHMTRVLSQRLVDTTRHKFKAKDRPISVLWGKGGIELARALVRLLKGKVGLLPLVGAHLDSDVTLSSGIMLLPSAEITEENLAEHLGIQVEVFSHILILLPAESNALARKAVDLADTVISVGHAPAWIKNRVDAQKLWQADEDLTKLDRIARRLTGRTVGLALSSGGARGLAHIGVIKVLRQENIPIDLMAGSSAGAFFGSFFAAGWSNERFEKFAEEIKTFNSIRNWDINLPPRSGLLRGARAKHLIERLLDGRNFADLDIPFYCVAADIMTGEEVIFGPDSSVPLSDAIRASISIPMVADPWQINGRYLIDGATVDPVPAKLLRDKGADIVIASSVIQPLHERPVNKMEKMPHFMTIISNILGSMEAELVKSQEEFVDVLIHSKAEALHNLDFDNAQNLIRVGEMAARVQLPAIRSLLEGNGQNHSSNGTS